MDLPARGRYGLAGADISRQDRDKTGEGNRAGTPAAFLSQPERQPAIIRQKDLDRNDESCWAVIPVEFLSHRKTKVNPPVRKLKRSCDRPALEERAFR